MNTASTLNSANEWYKRFSKELSGWPADHRHESLRLMCRTDLYFLIRYILNRPDIEHPWLWQRCVEVQGEPNGYLDIWAREHYKSTIITFGLTIQDILANHGETPTGRWAAQGIEPTIGIFSHTRPTAKKFLRQIKQEFEQNRELITLFPDVLWDSPQKQAPKWSEDEGLAVKRKTNPKEQTVEAWGVIDAQPTGAHFTIRVYDDVVEQKAVQTVESMRRTTSAWELSENLGARGGVARYPGTRYHLLDTYGEMIRRGAVKVRKHAATKDGKPDGEPVYLTSGELAEKRRKMGSFTFACQMLQDPQADQVQGFSRHDMQFYDNRSTAGLNVYMLIDPANEKKKTSDYTSLFVIGLGADRNYIVLDMVRDRLNLTERGALVIAKHKEWGPIRVGYEKYGMQADIEYIKTLQETENYRFTITPLAGSLGNIDRVRRLIPSHEEQRWYYPKTLSYTTYEGKSVDLVQVFTDEELVPFPVGMHADMMDAQSRIMDEDLQTVWPMAEHDSTPMKFAGWG